MTEYPIIYVTAKGGQYPDELAPRVIDSGTFLEKCQKITEGSIVVTDLRELELLVTHQTLFGVRPRSLLKVPGAIYPPSWLHIASALPMATLETIDGDTTGTTPEIASREESMTEEGDRFE